MRILLLGSDNLAGHLRKLGQAVWTCAPEPSADLPLPDHDPPWARLEKLGRVKGLTWDAIVVTDHLGGRRLPTGLAQAPAVTAFWGLDAPLNGFWQPDYARLFDIACLDQPSQARELARCHAGAHWLPVGVDAALYRGHPPTQQEPGVCFVGVVNGNVRPKRSSLLAKIAKLAPLQVRGGRQGAWFSTQQAAELYRSHQVVLNENLFPGLTTRPLEAMAAGGCLLSESAPGSMDLYFTEGQHLAYFDPTDIKHKLELMLRNTALRRRLARAGRQVVLEGHTLEHRAAQLVAWLEDTARTPLSDRPRAKGGLAQMLEGRALLWAGLRWPREGGGQRLLRAWSRLQAAAADGAPPLPAQRAAGLALAALGREDEALEYLGRAAEMGHALDALALGLLAYSVGKSDVCRSAWGRAGIRSAQPGQAGFHAEAAGLLRLVGRDLQPGFDLRACPAPAWCALEHLLEITRLEPQGAEAWIGLGDLLLQRQAPNQAAACYERATDLGHGPRVADRLRQAMVEGYMI